MPLHALNQALGDKGAASASQRIPFDITQLLTGLPGDQLKTAGAARYPQESDPLNRTAHREGARRMTERIGAVPTQALGVGNELMEAAIMKMAGSEAPLIGYGEDNPGTLIDLGDIGANMRGSLDATVPEWETNEGLFNEMLRTLFQKRASEPTIQAPAIRGTVEGLDLRPQPRPGVGPGGGGDL